MQKLLYIPAVLLFVLACGISAPMQLPSPSDAPAPSNPRVFARDLDESTLYTVTGDLYIRADPSDKNPPIGLLQAGDTVTCSEWVGVWCRHELGWSHGGWLK